MGSKVGSSLANFHIDSSPDGNELLVHHYIFMLIMAITIFVILYKLYKKNKSTKSMEVSQDNFYILGKYTEEKPYNSTIEMLLLFVLPLNILKALSKDKAIYFKHIIIVSIIMSVFNSQNYFRLGMGLYSLNVLLNFIYGFVCCYSYALFYYRGKKPLTKFLIISIIYNILIMLGVILTSKI